MRDTHADCEDVEPGDLILTVPTPFPVLHIERVQSGFYRWALSLASQVFEQDEGASSIVECLSQAVRNLPEDGKAVEIRYRGIGLGTFQAQSLQEAPDLLAERIVEMFSAVMDGIAKRPA